MYNAEIKTKFIESYTNSIKTKVFCEVMFNAIEKYELEWGADLCTKDATTLKDVFSKLSGLRKKTQTSTLGFFKSYVSWCIENKIPNACDGALLIRENSLRGKMVWSPLELQQFLDAVFEKESELTVDNTYRCFYWLAYGGMSEEDILSVKRSNVDLVNRVVNWRGEAISIYPEAFQCIKNCALLKEFVIKRNYITSIPRTDGDALLRGTRGELSLKPLRTIISRKISAGYNTKTDMRLTYYRTWLSGLFYRLSIMERSQIPITDDVLLNLICKNQSLSDKLKGAENNPEVYKKKLSEIRRDYSNWKRANN